MPTKSTQCKKAKDPNEVIVWVLDVGTAGDQVAGSRWLGAQRLGEFGELVNQQLHICRSVGKGN